MHHCQRYIEPPTTRRDMLRRCANGFGAVALTSLWADKAFCGGDTSPGGTSTKLGSLAPRKPHFAPKANSVIFLYMDGGPSQVDTFDPKPMLDRFNGQDPRQVIGKLEATQFDNVGRVLKSPWKFHNRGKSGLPISDLFPHVATCADELAVIRSMVSDFSEHTNANYFLHTGSGLQGRPSMGAWTTYGLGSECQNLPGFVVINSGLIPPGGLDNFNSGFLPATYQGSIFRPDNPPVANVGRTERSDKLQTNKLELMRQLDRGVLNRLGHVDQLESAIANHELAYKMQMAVPDLMNLSKETQKTKRAYGLESKYKQTTRYGTACLVARRLVERGVRFIELTCPQVGGDRWDQHGGLKQGHENNARAVDQPIAALLKDLRQRGLLDTTLVVWSGEFGRTPFAQGSNGRDHNPFGFSMWMAGGGIKGGMAYGSTDEWGYKTVENRVEIHDLHATMLHLLGLDHRRVTYRFSGRDIRLTDVKGEVVRDILV